MQHADAGSLASALPQKGRDRRVALTLFAAAFAVNLTCFSLAGEPFPKFWVYATDNSAPSLAVLRDPNETAVYQLRKHPLYVALGLPIFELGRLAFDSFEEPTRSNLASVLVAALAGALAVVAAWLLLRRVCGASGLAAPALLLYASAGSVLVFSGYPETYSMASLALNVFLLGLLCWPSDAVYRPALANSLAALIGPPLVLLSVVQGLRYLRLGFAVGSGKVARYAAAVAVLYFIPFALLNGFHERGYSASKMKFVYKELRKNVTAKRNEGMRSDLGTWASIVANHGLYASVSPLPEIGPETDIKTGTHYATGAIHRAGMAYQIVAWPFLALVIGGILSALRRPPPSLPFARELVGFLVAWLLLVGLVNPAEPFLYTMPFVLPLLLVVVAAFSRSPLPRSAQTLAWGLAILSAATNLRLASFLRTLL